MCIFMLTAEKIIPAECKPLPGHYPADDAVGGHILLRSGTVFSPAEIMVSSTGLSVWRLSFEVLILNMVTGRNIKSD